MRETFFELGMPRLYLFGAKSLPHHHEPLLEAAGVPIAVVPEAGHAMPGENPEAFAAIIASSLTGGEVPPPYRRTAAAASAAALLTDATPKRKA